MPMGMDASMLIPSGLLSPPSLDPSPLSQAVSASIGRQPGNAGQQLGNAGQRTRSSLNPAAPGFTSMRTPVANGLHPGPPKQQAPGEGNKACLSAVHNFSYSQPVPHLLGLLFQGCMVSFGLHMWSCTSISSRLHTCDS